jgi:hypothetical protein
MKRDCDQNYGRARWHCPAMPIAVHYYPRRRGRSTRRPPAPPGQPFPPHPTRRKDFSCPLRLDKNNGRKKVPDFQILTP